MGTDYRGSAGMQGIKETVFSGMAQVNHHACAVHLPNDLMTEITQSAMFMTGFGSGITDVVVSVMAESHIDYTLLAEVFNVAEIFSDGITVFYSFHNG